MVVINNKGNGDNDNDVMMGIVEIDKVIRRRGEC